MIKKINNEEFGKMLLIHSPTFLANKINEIIEAMNKKEIEFFDKKLEDLKNEYK